MEEVWRPKARRGEGDRTGAALTFVFSVPILATAAPPMVGAAKAWKAPEPEGQ